MKKVRSRLAVWYLTTFRGFSVVLRKDIPRAGAFGRPTYRREFYLRNEGPVKVEV